MWDTDVKTEAEETLALAYKCWHNNKREGNVDVLEPLEILIIMRKRLLSWGY